MGNVPGFRWTVRLLAALGILITSGCTAYHKHTLDAPRLERDFSSRSLNDAGLREFVKRFGVGTEWPPKALDVQSLTWIALYYSPEVRLAQAQLRVAEQQVVAAGARPNPSLSAESGYNRNPESAKIFSLVPTFTIETAGKRGYRILEAEKSAEAARLAVDEAGWQARSRVRSALASYLFAVRRRDLLKREVVLRTEIVEIFEKRLQVGEVARPEVDGYRADLAVAQTGLRAADGEVNSALAAVAGTAGMPAAAVKGTPLAWPDLDSPPPEDRLPLQTVQTAGLLNRTDVRRLVAAYAAADAALRLEVARQYPDIELGPSYRFEEGYSHYTFAGALAPIPVFHRNHGMIGVAEARRAQVEAQVEAAQAAAIGEMETALARYRGSLAEWREAAQRLRTIRNEQEKAAVQALDAGEGDRLSVAQARLQSAAAQQADLAALERVQTALGALEDAVEHPLGGSAEVGP